MFFEKMEKFQLVLLAIILAFGLVLAVKTATGTLSNDKITVTGSAYKIVKSDSARMEFEITNRSANRQTAYNKVKAQLPIVKQYLQDKGITDIDVLRSVCIVKENTVNTFFFQGDQKRNGLVQCAVRICVCLWDIGVPRVAWQSSLFCFIEYKIRIITSFYKDIV